MRAIKTGGRIAAGFVAAILALSPIASADEAKPGHDAPSQKAGLDLPARVETHHTIQFGQRSLDYRAAAETIALSDGKGNNTASVFTISYLTDPKPGQPRPVAFFFNGGPGAAAVFLHLGAVGPRIMEDTPTGAVPDPPVRIVDNPSTWLDFTDLVFVDPVGTGFSRGEGKDDNPNKPFLNVRGDIDSLDAVVRLWLTKHERWSAPVYLVGESYGGFRVAAMAKSLAHDEGVVPSGIIMLSPALDTALLNPDAAALVAGAVNLPTFAASAAVLSGNPRLDTGPVEQFALSDYLVGLAAMKGVPPPGDPFIARVAAMIGLPADIVRRERGWVGKEVFARELRRAQDQVLSLYDGTITRPAPANPWDQTAGDPVLDNAIAAYTQAFNSYAPAELGYHTELQYRVLPMSISRQWNFDGAREGRDGLGLALSGLQTALLEHPATKVLIANGRYDLVTPYFASRWLIDQLAIPEAVRAAIRLKIYDGGHMMYLRAQSRDALAADAAALFAAGAKTP
ncbi:MAG TPA: septum formation initiator [Stellaceae bacterium]|nr:septum formation initiator [Stellaceae bacterium]